MQSDRHRRVRTLGPSEDLQGLAILPLGRLEAAPDVEQRAEIQLAGEHIGMRGPQEATSQGDGPGEEGLGLVESSGLARRRGQGLEDLVRPAVIAAVLLLAEGEGLAELADRPAGQSHLSIQLCLMLS